MIFFLVFLLIYGGMQYFFYFSTMKALQLSATGNIILIVYLLLQTILPIVHGTLLRFNYTETARFTAWPAFIWFGFSFMFLTYKLFFLFLNIVFKLQFSHVYLLNVILCIILIIYGFFNSFSPKLVSVNIKSDKIKSSVKIVQISDTHFDTITPDSYTEKLVNKINSVNPDIIVWTGDIIDGITRNREHKLQILKKLNAKSGKFAVTGNHEYYHGFDQAISFIKDTDFKLIDTQTININDELSISGVPDKTAKFMKKNYKDESSLIENIKKDNYNILLKHEPLINKKTDNIFDLQLSGHTHNGQIFPFFFLTRLRYKYMSGLYSVSDTLKIYVNRGSRTWGPPIRLFLPPEITVITITGK